MSIDRLIQALTNKHQRDKQETLVYLADVFAEQKCVCLHFFLIVNSTFCIPRL